MRIVPGIVIGFAGMLAMASPVLAFSQDQASASPQPTPAPAGVDQSFPKWSEFPLPPTDVPTVAQIRDKVETELQQRQDLDQTVSAFVWDQDIPQDFSSAAQGRLNPAALKTVDAPMTAAQMDAWASELRRKAAPPPVVN